MITKHIINLHGFGSAGGLKNEKAQYFNQHFQSFAEIAFHSIDFTPTPKDLEYHTIILAFSLIADRNEELNHDR